MMESFEFICVGEQNFFFRFKHSISCLSVSDWRQSSSILGLFSGALLKRRATEIAFSAISNPLTLVRQPTLARDNQSESELPIQRSGSIVSSLHINLHNHGHAAIESHRRPRAQHARLPPRLHRLRPSARIDCADDTRRVQDAHKDRRLRPC